MGKCIGPKDNDCLACRDDRVLVLPSNKQAGSCTSCADTCAQMKCIDSGSDQCTQCPLNRVLVLKANASKVAGAKLLAAKEAVATANATKSDADLKLTEMNQSLFDARRASEVESSEAVDLQLQDAKVAYEEAKHQVNA